MSNTPFHPIIEEWFSARFGAPTEAQRLGWPEIAAGRHVLIAAPTGSGKTLAAFLDDAPLEERRARAVLMRRTLAPGEAKDLARLDEAAIAQVREEAWPVVRDAEELHGALLSLGALPVTQGRPWRSWFESLAAEGRAGEWHREGLPPLWAAAERWSMLIAACSGGRGVPEPARPEPLVKAWEEADAVRGLVRGRLEAVGPTTTAVVARDLGLDAGVVASALAALENEGFALQGSFTDATVKEWCERRLLARIHRLTIDGA